MSQPYWDKAFKTASTHPMTCVHFAWFKYWFSIDKRSEPLEEACAPKSGWKKTTTNSTSTTHSVGKLRLWFENIHFTSQQHFKHSTAPPCSTTFPIPTLHPLFENKSHHRSQNAKLYTYHLAGRRPILAYGQVKEQH